MIARTQYIEDRTPGAHHHYYAQFVTEPVINAVVQKIGTKALRGSSDYHLNDIPLQIWDSLSFPVDKKLLEEAGEGFSLSTKVCIAKTAARIWLKRDSEKSKK